MLAYYVEWNMREAWRPLMFTDQEQQAKQTRDPVAPAKRSAAGTSDLRGTNSRLKSQSFAVFRGSHGTSG